MIRNNIHTIALKKRYPFWILSALFFITHNFQAASPNTITGIVIPLQGGISFTRPQQVAFTPDGSKAYVTNFGSTSVAIIDPTTNKAIGFITPDISNPFSGPAGIAITPDGTTGYITNLNNNTVSVFNVATNTVTATITSVSFDQPFAIAITGNKAYVGNFNGNSVSVIDTQTNTFLHTVSLGTFNQPTNIAITPDGSKAYVANSGGTTVCVINTTTDAVIHDVTGTFARPSATAFTSDGAKAYITNYANNTVDIIDVNLDTQIGSITNSSFQLPLSLAITPDNTKAYVVNTNTPGGSISIIDLTTDTFFGMVSDPLYTLYNPTSIAIAPDGLKAYITNSNGNTVSILYIGNPPPASIQGCATQNAFLAQVDFINELTWTAPASGPTPLSYALYRDAALTQLIATIAADEPLRYCDHNRTPNIAYSYYIVSIDADGNASEPAIVTVPRAC